MVDTKELKQKFENWVKDSGDPDYKSYLECDADGHYKLGATIAGWAAWQAAWYGADAQIESLTAQLEEARHSAEYDRHRMAIDAEFCINFRDTFEAYEKALEQIATGEISGEKSNYKDTLAIVKQIAKQALTLQRK